VINHLDRRWLKCGYNGRLFVVVCSWSAWHFHWYLRRCIAHLNRCVCRFGKRSWSDDGNIDGFTRGLVKGQAVVVQVDAKEAQAGVFFFDALGGCWPPCCEGNAFSKKDLVRLCVVLRGVV
jgi:hypothetical protein